MIIILCLKRFSIRWLIKEFFGWLIPLRSLMTNCYIGSDVWFQDYFWETSSLGFQSSFSMTWYLEEILGNIPWWISLGRCFRDFEYCFAVWWSAADTHFKLLYPVVSGARFLTGSVFECNIAYRRSVAVLFMLCKIMCRPMHPLYGALTVPYVPVRATRGDFLPHLYTYAPPRCGAPQYRMTFISSQCVCPMILLTLHSMV